VFPSLVGKQGCLAPASALACPVVADAVQAESLREVWSDLLQRCERHELTQSPDWLLTWWNSFGSAQGRQLRLGMIRDGDRLIGLAPLLRRWHWYRGCLPFRRLELLGSGEPDDQGIFSNHIGILAERGMESQVAQQLVEAISNGAFGSWDEVVLPMMSGDTLMPEMLADAFRAAGYSAETKATAGAPYIPLPASWKEYLHDLSANSRRNIERSIKAFDKWSAGTTELECISVPADVERGSRILMSLHHERWSNDDQTGVFRAPPFLDFHARMMRTLAERGCLELLILKAHGEPMAALYSMVWDNKVYGYQTGRRTDVPANVRPGGVVMALAIRRAIEQGRREFDLLADEAFYKSQLTSHVRPLVQVRATRRCVAEMARTASAAILARFRRLRAQREAP
jgi:CelD/BcsL family acetyltransferase involved in cellulose biosynthesis